MNSTPNPPLNVYQNVEGVALLILTLGEDISAEVLKGFSHDEIKKLAHAMSKMKDIKADDALKSIIGFFDDFRKHSGIIGGTRQYLTNVLEKNLNGNLAKDLVSEIYGDEIRSYAEQLVWIPADILADDLRKEHIMMQALLIAHLPVDYTAKVLEQYSIDECNELIYQITKTQVLTAAIAETLKDLIQRCKDHYNNGAPQTLKGTKVVADIINRFQGDKTSIFAYLTERDEKTATEIQEAMFDFYTLFTQSSETIDVINNEVTTEQWAMAMKGLPDENRQVIFSTMPTRLATQLRENIERSGAVPVSQVEGARKEILEIVRRLQKEGTIQLSLSNELRLT
ncbi:FliG C-terminal domain-containing protein [Vibrio furnissii]|uniref:FliG C-terminal domain-containing protein n=1 Tax=Vibrio furnissii TaxID=29494 RepID=UPI003AA7AD0F